MNNIILGLDEHGKPCVAGSCKILLLKHFHDILQDSFKSKQFTCRIDQSAQVPGRSLELWRKRGYDPASVGVAHVVFDATPGKIYDYPAFLWSE